MTIIIFSYPQLILALHKDEKVRSLESLTSESGIPNINVMVMDDYKKDSRINLIKYMTDRKEKDGSVYYSESENGKKIITLNLGYGYIGPVSSKDENGDDTAEVEHWPEDVLREKHIERIGKLGNIKTDLNPEEVAEEYKLFFNNLKKYKKI
jgi:hypothetical protein